MGGNAPTNKRKLKGKKSTNKGDGHGGTKNPSSSNRSSKKKATKKKQSQAKAPLPSRNKGSLSQDSLIAQIRGKSASGRSGFDSMMAGLEARYGGKKKKGGKQNVDMEDEEFATIQAKLMANKKAR